jgi:hypothetical protein
VSAITCYDRFSFASQQSEFARDSKDFSLYSPKFIEKIRNLILPVFNQKEFSCSNPQFEAILVQQNKTKPIENEVVLVVQAKADYNGAFSDCESIIELANKHFVLFKVIDSPNALFSEVEQVAKDLKEQGRGQIKTLIVRGHGSNSSIRIGFGDHQCLTRKHFHKGCFDQLSPDARILLHSCSLAKTSFWQQSLAKVISDAAGSSRIVRAFKIDIGGVQYKICLKHGIVMDAGNHSLEDYNNPEAIHFSNGQICSMNDRIMQVVSRPAVANS